MTRAISCALIWATMFAVVAIAAPAPAAAQTCTVTIGSQSFGNIDLTANTTYPTTSNIHVSCSGLSLNTVRVCANIGAGTGGANPSGAPRTLLLASNLLNYNLYQDAAHTIVWGSALSGTYQPAPIDVALNVLGNGTADRILYGQVSAGQQSQPSGTYMSSFAGHATASYAYAIVGSCAAIGTTNQTPTPFTVTATAIDVCTLSASAMSFGDIPATSSAVNASSTLTTRCSASTPYTITLNGGLTGATNPTLRKMRQGSNELTYGLYRDAARSLAWGSSAGVNDMSGSGTGFSQPIPVFGRVPQQSTPPAGIYSDTIIATIAY